MRRASSRSPVDPDEKWETGRAETRWNLVWVLRRSIARTTPRLSTRPVRSLLAPGRHKEVFHSSGSLPGGVHERLVAHGPQRFAPPQTWLFGRLEERFTLNRVPYIRLARLAF